MFQPRKRQSFKERGKAAAGLGPRQFHHAHPVLGALQARRRGMQNSSILTGVQMSPFPLYEHQPEREWRHLDTRQYRTILHAGATRLPCPEPESPEVTPSLAKPGTWPHGLL